MVRAVLAEFLRDVRDVHVLVLHLHEAQVLLGLHLAGRRRLLAHGLISITVS